MKQASDHALDLKVPVAKPYNARPLLAYLSVRAIDGVELVEGERYSRVVRIGGKSRVLTVDFSRAGTDGVVASCVPGRGLDLEAVRRTVGALVDADAPVATIERRLAEDPILAPLVRRNSGARIPRSVDAFELAVRAILGQQVSIAAARTFAGRVAARWGWVHETGPPGLAFAFPDPARLADAPLEQAGLSRGRAEAIRGLAGAVLDGRIDLRPSQDPGLTEESLLGIKGIGPWTAAYISLRGLGNRDAIPVGDLGLRAVLGGGNGACLAREVAERADAWRPWRGYGAVHLWNTFLPL